MRVARYFLVGFLMLSFALLAWSILSYINYSISMRYEVVDPRIILGNSADITAREKEINSLKFFFLSVSLYSLFGIAISIFTLRRIRRIDK